MTAFQNAQLQMAAAVKAVCDAHNASWTGSAHFAGPYADFTDALKDSNKALGQQGTRSTGATRVKRRIRENLEALVNQVANSLKLYGQINGLPPDENAQMAPSSVKKLADKALVGHAAKLANLTTGLTTPSLTTVNLPDSVVTALRDATAVFTNVIGSPRRKQEEARDGTRQLAAQIEKIMNLLNQMDESAAVLRYTLPAFYAEYITARVVIDPGYRTRSLLVKVKISGTGKTIEGARAMINPGKIDKTSGRSGTFYINHLATGTYTMVLSNEGFEAKTAQFTIAANQATVVDVELVAVI